MSLLTFLARSRPNQIVVGTLDVVFIGLSIWTAYLLRFDGMLSPELYRQMLVLVPCLILIKMPVFSLLGLYRGMWRYTSVNDLFAVLKAVVVSSALIITILIMINRLSGLSRAVFVLDAIFTFLFIAGARIGIRYLYQFNNDPVQILMSVFPLHRRQAGKKLLLVGAGNTAEKVLREIHENQRLPYKVAGLVDDDPQKKGLHIHGVPVLGTLDNLKTVAGRCGATELLIAISAASAEQMKRIVGLCRETHIPYKILPGMHELIHGNVSLKTMRDVSYKDLLGRPLVRLQQDEIGKSLAGKTVLVTGAGGSIGSELCRQILKFDPEKLILFDAGEENLYNIQMELQHELEFTRYVAVLGKIQNRKLLEKVLITQKPTVVFHAAAYKHVPLVEQNPWEAVFNNVFAVRNLIEVSINYQVERFVLVSTDKAVRPTNVMGASKRLTELLMLAYSQEKWDASICQGRSRWLQKQCNLSVQQNGRCTHATTFMAVRFGNVLGSSGSVIPLFKRQIEMGGPVTVTHPEVTRYFMSIEEAAQLILQAGVMGKGGEIFLLRMGEPINIANMAKDLIAMSGKSLETEIEIKFTGLRPGEKLYEELITEGEGIVATSHEKIMVLRGDGVSYAELQEPLHQLAERAKAHDAQGIKKIFAQIIPEYVPDLQAVSVAPAAVKPAV